MQRPPPRNISIVLIVFVLTPYGEIETVAGVPRDLDEMLELAEEPRSTAAVRIPVGGIFLSERLRNVLRDSLRVHPASLELTSRVYPLIPRILEDGAICLPLWTTGRIADAADGRPNRGLADLAHAIGDASLEGEAEPEVRRRLAADPLAHQMVGEATRLRALAADEASRELPHGEVPPIFALMPELFTIDQLRVAAAPLAAAAGAEIERSSNFRRRVTEFLESGVLVDCGEAVGMSHRGRPPRLYRFDPDGWRYWLSQRSQPQRSDDAAVRYDMALRAERIAEFIEPEPLATRPVSPAVPMASDADEVPYVRPVTSSLEARLSTGSGSPKRREVGAGESPHAAGRTPRVDELERQVERLSGEVQAGREQMSELMRILAEELRARRAGDEGPRR